MAALPGLSGVLEVEDDIGMEGSVMGLHEA